MGGFWNTGGSTVPERLEKFATENNSILCFGIDPNGEEKDIYKYYTSIVDALLERGLVSAIKPNYAYFAARGFNGLKVLKRVMERYEGKTFVILDAKRGDIGRSSDAYSREVFDFWGADAVTVSPYMGSDSVGPFLQKGKVVYVLGRTSNPGAKDFQELKLKNGKYVYEEVCRKAASWGAGLVVGATSSTALGKVVKGVGKDTPLLIPGIGKQGGSFDVLKVLRGNPFIHRVNSSSSIAQAWRKRKGGPVEAAVKEAEFLNTKINKRVF